MWNFHRCRPRTRMLTAIGVMQFFFILQVTAPKVTNRKGRKSSCRHNHKGCFETAQANGGLERAEDRVVDIFRGGRFVLLRVDADRRGERVF